MIPNCRRLALVLALATAACVSAPVARVALPLAPPPADGTPGRDAGPTVLLRPVSLPGYLDGFPVVVARSGNALAVSPDTEWAERLSDAAARVLREALARRLGPSRVLIAGDGRIPDADLTVEFLALDPLPGSLLLDAAWSYACTAPDRPHRSGRARLEVPLAAASPSAVASATADALGRFADALAKEASCAGPAAGKNPA